MFGKYKLIKIKDYLWEIPKNFRSDMRVPARIYASEEMIESILADRSLEQLVNVATLPGIQKNALAMPDIHEGYGFPIGGVAAFAAEEGGIISPGGVGYDINCGVRLLRSSKTFKEIADRAKELADRIYQEVPSGVGRGGDISLKDKEFDLVLERGAARIVEMGYGKENDLSRVESEGKLNDADPGLVSSHAKERGGDQLGTMGAGNHFVEVGAVDEIFNKEEAGKMGLFQGQITVLIHTGSRGLGHQVATDYIKRLMKGIKEQGIFLVDRELVCAPFVSKNGQQYFKAMAAAANFAWANRQVITWRVRKAWKKVLSEQSLEIVYDVAHNIAKVEEYEIDGVRKKVVVHRKGATRAFPGQPVIIPGSMGTNSYVLAGREKSLSESFGSTCHGAGRTMSRTKAKKEINAGQLKKELEAKGIVIRAGSLGGLSEEAPSAYKDVGQVVDVIDTAGIAERVARLKPIAVIKG